MPNASDLRTWKGSAVDLQAECAVTVVMTSVMRPSLERALQSVFAQDIAGPVQILVGVDVPRRAIEALDEVCRAVPDRFVVQALYPGYSTSVRHGGLWPAHDGGALRTTLSYLAHAPLIAYLDDDNWWAPDHLSSLARAIEFVDWAFSLRWFVHPDSAAPICVDQWESVGPGAGLYAARWGGFVDPNCLMLKRDKCMGALQAWTTPLTGDHSGMSADRSVFLHLSRNHKSAGSGNASVYYRIDPEDVLQSTRLQHMGPAYAAAGSPRSG
jgi:hypothetical protein